MRAKDLIKLVEEEDYISSKDPGAKIKQDYDVDADGVIRSPGKFEREMYYVVYYYDAGMNGMADEDDGSNWLFNLGPEDYQKFPELEGSKNILVYTDSQGFAYGEENAEMPEPEEEPEEEE